MSAKTQKLILGAIKIFLVLSMFVAGAYFYNQLPQEIPTHRNIAGVADAYGPKIQTLLGIPAIALFLLLLFYFLPKRDPRKQNYALFGFAWETIQFATLGFFVYFYAIVLYVTLHPQVLITPFVLMGLGTMFVALGFAMRHVKQNYFVGIRTPWTLENETVRNKTHKLGGILFALSGLLILGTSFYTQFFLPILIFSIVVSALIPAIYSFVIYKQAKK